MWDQRYGEPGYAYGTAPNDFLAAHAARYLPVAGEVLCLAEGEGRNAVFLARLGFRVTGVDGSAVGLEKARQLAAENSVEIQTIVADLGGFDLGVGRWDGSSRSGATRRPRSAPDFIARWSGRSSPAAPSFWKRTRRGNSPTGPAGLPRRTCS